MFLIVEKEKKSLTTKILGSLYLNAEVEQFSGSSAPVIRPIAASHPLLFFNRRSK
jgi:hypothetical protein